ncbi:hypothetical protein GCM10010232_48980 [Streptomyces amakusaensis]|uniref:Uncharacterized protein n=1 Tax=Streptomyces amakusaensis TaxID=67271 RepID=A0ABW0AM24_9ACTN
MTRTVVLHPGIRAHLARLGGIIPDIYARKHQTVITPSGRRPVPLPVRALMAVTWPDGHTLRTVAGDLYDGEDVIELPCRNRAPQEVPGGGAWMTVGHDHAGGYWLVDLDQPPLPDPVLVRTGAPGRRGTGELVRMPLSRLLTHLTAHGSPWPDGVPAPAPVPA